MALGSEAAETFIEVEVSSAELFANLALNAREDETCERHLLNAKIAYDAATRFLPGTKLSKSRQADFRRRLGDVRLTMARIRPGLT